MQHVLEGQINEPSQGGAHSTGSSPSEPYVLAEGIPEELGHEWKVLHPFEIRGVRFILHQIKEDWQKMRP